VSASIHPARSARAPVTVALVLVQVFFGLHYLAAKILLEFIPPLVWAALRAVAAAGVLLVAVRILGRRLPRAPGDLLHLAGLAVFGVGINQVCFVEGLHRTTPAHSSIIMTGIPVGTLLFGVLLGRESVTGPKLLSLAASFAGVVLVILAGRAAPAAGADLRTTATIAGDLLTVANALSYSLFLVLSKRILSRIDSLGATTTLMAFGSLGISLVALPSLVGFDPRPVPAAVWGLGVLIVLFPTALAYLLMYWALARVGSYVVALFIYLQPLIATGLSVVWLGERVTAGFVAGGFLIFAGVYCAVRSG
jgi:drug/metabolite transporter (DMT)-like permease